MLTILFVVLVLYTASKAFAMLDGQQVASAEIGSYLHYEYNMETGAHTTLSQLNNI